MTQLIKFANTGVVDLVFDIVENGEPPKLAMAERVTLKPKEDSIWIPLIAGVREVRFAETAGNASVGAKEKR